jgi:hypothetical protein
MVVAGIETSKSEHRDTGVFLFVAYTTTFLGFYRKNFELSLRSFSRSKKYENVTDYTFSHLFVLVMVT